MSDEDDPDSDDSSSMNNDRNCTLNGSCMRDIN